MAEERDIWATVAAVFREMFDDEHLEMSAATTAADVDGWDSLTHIQLLLALEQRFHIKFNTGEIAGLANVGEMVSLIARKSATHPQGR